MFKGAGSRSLLHHDVHAAPGSVKHTVQLVAAALEADPLPRGALQDNGASIPNRDPRIIARRARSWPCRCHPVRRIVLYLERHVLVQYRCRVGADRPHLSAPGSAKLAYGDGSSRGSQIRLRGVALGGTTDSKDNQHARSEDGDDPVVNHLLLLTVSDKASGEPSRRGGKAIGVWLLCRRAAGTTAPVVSGVGQPA